MLRRVLTFSISALALSLSACSIQHTNRGIVIGPRRAAPPSPTHKEATKLAPAKQKSATPPAPVAAASTANRKSPQTTDKPPKPPTRPPPEPSVTCPHADPDAVASVLTPGSWIIVHLPDTQNYNGPNADFFPCQTQWIARNARKYNIQYVIQTGDITGKNARSEWINARKALAFLDKAVPYQIVPGNHDTGIGGHTKTRDTTHFNEYFPLPIFQRRATFGGIMEPGKLDNNYHLFSAGGRDWILLGLEFGPRESVVKWGNDILRQYPNRLAIVVTHCYMQAGQQRYDSRKRPSGNPHHYEVAALEGGVNDGEDLWNKLVSKQPNVMMTMNGHAGLAFLSSTGEHGNIVHQLGVNYEREPNGGSGFLRLMEFLPDGKTVRMLTYSPSLNEFKTDPQNQFEIELKPAPAPPTPAEHAADQAGPTK